VIENDTSMSCGHCRKTTCTFVDVAVVMATVAMVMVNNRKPTLTVLEAIFKK
jgi:hypothetical protein